MLWRAALSDVASERQHFISLAQHCHTLRVRFPNTLDEVQMLQKLDDSALPVICWVASGTAKTL